jgi:hypothetical protein
MLLRQDETWIPTTSTYWHQIRGFYLNYMQSATCSSTELASRLVVSTKIQMSHSNWFQGPILRMRNLRNKPEACHLLMVASSSNSAGAVKVDNARVCTMAQGDRQLDVEMSHSFQVPSCHERTSLDTSETGLV